MDLRDEILSLLPSVRQTPEVLTETQRGLEKVSGVSEEN